MSFIWVSRLREHTQGVDKNPVLIFPEGTCVNNHYTVMFKKVHTQQFPLSLCLDEYDDFLLRYYYWISLDIQQAKDKFPFIMQTFMPFHVGCWWVAKTPIFSYKLRFVMFIFGPKEDNYISCGSIYTSLLNYSFYSSIHYTFLLYVLPLNLLYPWFQKEVLNRLDHDFCN